MMETNSGRPELSCSYASEIEDAKEVNSSRNSKKDGQHR